MSKRKREEQPSAPRPRSSAKDGQAPPKKPRFGDKKNGQQSNKGFSNKASGKSSGKGGKPGSFKPRGKGSFKSNKDGGDKPHGDANSQKKPSGKGKEEKKLLTRKDRKDMKKQRKANKPNADVVQEVNKVYTLKLKQMKRPEREEKIAGMLASAKGKMREIATKHDVSRVLQLAIKHGSDAQRASVFSELVGGFGALAKHHYGHFIVIKFIQYGARAQKEAIARELLGKARKLSLHADAAKVLDYMYASGDKRQKQQLLEEFFGPEYGVFREQVALGLIKVNGVKVDPAGAAPAAAATAAAASSSADGKTVEAKVAGPKALRLPPLKEILAQFPERRDVFVKSMEEFIQKAIDKQMLMFRYVHGLLVQVRFRACPNALAHCSLLLPCAQYFENAPAAKVLDMIGQLSKYIQALHHHDEGALLLSCPCHALC